MRAAENDFWKKFRENEAEAKRILEEQSRPVNPKLEVIDFADMIS